MKKICENCKYWRIKIKHIDDKRFRACDSPKISEDDCIDEYSFTDTLNYPYHEGGYFLTGKDFGCVNWEKKEK